MRYKPRVVSGVRMQIGPDKVDWIDLHPNVIVLHDEVDDSFEITFGGKFKLKGTNPVNWVLSREA